jgi:glycosyltransferase involved in cell wall biosynthesis
MMASLGHDVYHYGGEGSQVECKEHIPIITADQHRRWWGDNDWRRDFFAIDWNPALEYWQVANANAIRAIKERIRPRDFICLIGGNCQKPIADAFPTHMSVEFGIGYSGVFSQYKVFESYAWMHHVYGLMGQGDGHYYDAVIPNYFDPDDFHLGLKEDYFLYVGRLIRRKGLELAVEATRRAKAKLLIAGQGVIEYTPGRIVTKELVLEGDHLEYIGVLDVESRAKYMSRARALFVPTIYIEPFGGVSIEAMLSGTPVISSDWGAFAENNVDGCTGYRVRSLGEAVWAISNLAKCWSPEQIRAYAISKFSIDVIRFSYLDYFSHLNTLWGEGWYSMEYVPFKRSGRGGSYS